MTPDRFERTVERVTYRDRWNIRCVSRKDALMLLRRQHAHIVRLVTRIEESEQYGDSYHDACAQLRAALAAYKKGKP